MELIKNYLRLLRINHWVKNFFIFIPVFFSAHIFDMTYIIRSIIGFVCFSFAASTIYIFNDWKDIEKDRLHPTKQKRPLAAGQIATKSALSFAFVLFTAAITLHVILIGEWISLGILSFYIAQNLLYTFRLKQIAIVDVTIISLGFVLRLVYGGTINGIALSEWIVLMTFLLSLFLAFSKRRNEIVLLDRTGISARKSIAGYNLQFIDISLSITASVVIIAYLMFSTSDIIILKFGKNIYITSFFVIIAIMRYLKLSIVENKSADPAHLLLKDLFLQLLIICWLIVFGFFIYKSSTL